jgi:hypothetical protein
MSEAYATPQQAIDLTTAFQDAIPFKDTARIRGNFVEYFTPLASVPPKLDEFLAPHPTTVAALVRLRRKDADSRLPHASLSFAWEHCPRVTARLAGDKNWSTTPNEPEFILSSWRTYGGPSYIRRAVSSSDQLPSSQYPELELTNIEETSLAAITIRDMHYQAVEAAETAAWEAVPSAPTSSINVHEADIIIQFARQFNTVAF